ncbi:MAG: hypothetical protein WDN06_20750 [Asticcacaulis sp.]
MSDLAAFKDDIEAAWDARDTLAPSYHGPYRSAVEKVLGLLDNGPLPRRRQDRRAMGNARLAEEGGAAVVPPQR